VKGRQTQPIPNVKDLDGLALFSEVETAVGQDTVHIHYEQLYAPGPLFEFHLRTVYTGLGTAHPDPRKLCRGFDLF
jgi:hypothetical protein